uniref:3-oxo-5alpha-steroid 4-dehydrogenase (NADP(+)) n=1 Tax=Syphacia muris TaxID=451379 RepID=A0A0N5B0N2_9BILA
MLRYLLLLISYSMILCGLSSCAIMLLGFKATYGRYSAESYNLPARLAWFTQELPSLLMPVFILIRSDHWGYSSLNTIIVTMFIIHYFQRSLIYPFLIRGGKPTPLHIWFMAIIFCFFNGALQGLWHIHYAVYPAEWWFNIRIWIGLLLFFTGMFINIQSDAILRNLRGTGEGTYKIPRGGLFEYISGANYFGECLEWFGFAICANTIPAFAFALFTICNIGPRAIHHHRWYLEKFEDYPKNRKALIMFLL